MKIPVSTLIGTPLAPQDENLVVEANLSTILRTRFFYKSTDHPDFYNMQNHRQEAIRLGANPGLVLKEFKKMEDEELGKYVYIDLGKVGVGYPGMPNLVFIPPAFYNDKAVIGEYEWEKA